MKFYEAQNYQPSLRVLFERLRETLRAALPFAKIEHVGSSSIHGAISKGDLDIFVGVSKTEFSSAVKKLENLGFRPKEDTLRAESLCMFITSEDFGADVAIQLVELGSKFEYFIEFRDCLNSQPSLVEEYNSLKKDSEHLDSKEYRVKKSDFISKVLGKS